MRRLVYNLINVAVIAASLIFINLGTFAVLNNFNAGILVLLFAIIFLIHGIKFLRLYFIILEEKMIIPDVLRLYVKTTFVNILLPFKIGELFKMYCIGYKTRNYHKGVSVVLIEKFFDAIMVLSSVALCLLLGGTVVWNVLIAVLIIFMIIFILFYFFFGQTYEYMNRFFMSKSSGKKSLNSLRALEWVNDFHKSLQKMLRGRQLVVFLLTFLSWAMEFAFVSLVQNGLEINMDFGSFVSYVSGAFVGDQGAIIQYYVYMCILILVGALILSYIWKLLSMRGRSK